MPNNSDLFTIRDALLVSRTVLQRRHAHRQLHLQHASCRVGDARHVLAVIALGESNHKASAVPNRGASQPIERTRKAGRMACGSMRNTEKNRREMHSAPSASRLTVSGDTV